ncbi:MAG TPA: hypothetical protein VLJ61_05570 [Pyrinomonadaceae bacterium]|nr:hypothetical protein [Pyrinomonadaceae bacterium]
MKLIFAMLCACLFAANAFAQTESIPRFESYPAPVYKGRVAPVRINTSLARTFRTRLHEGSKEGVNFAGHYTVVEWGCGAGCLDVAVVDAKTGAVYFPKELSGFGVWYWGTDDYDALQFKPDSRLIVLSGSPVSESSKAEPQYGLFYYEWTGNGLKLIKVVEKKRDEAR